MKCSPLTGIITIVAIALTFATQPVSANQTNGVDGDEALQDNQATALTTEAATITNRWGNGSKQTNNLNDSVSSISIIREEKCRKIDPNEILKNPGSFFGNVQ